MLLNNVLNQSNANAICEMLLRTMKVLFRPFSSALGDRDVALIGCVMCLGKVVSVKKVSISGKNLVEAVTMLLAILQDSGTCQISPETKVACLRVLKNICDAVDGPGTIGVNGTLLVAGLNGVQVLQSNALTMRSGRSSVDVAGEVVIAMETIISKLLQNIEYVYSLPNEGVPTVCSMMYSLSAQVEGASHWTSILAAIWSSRLGVLYMIDILGHVLTPVSPPRPEQLTKQFSLHIMQLLAAAVTYGSLTALVEAKHITTLMKGLEYTMPPLDLLVISSLINSTEGIVALLSTEGSVLLEALIATLKTTAENAATSSQLITMMISSGVENAVDVLLTAGLVESILTAMKQFSAIDETVAQNSVYMLRVLCDIVGIENVRLPKETIQILQDINVAFAYNSYCVETSSYVMSALSSAYAVGPEAQLENIIRDISFCCANSAGWNKIATDPNQIYFYNHVSGITQWEAPAAYSKLFALLFEMCEVLVTLKGNLEDVTISAVSYGMLYQLFVDHAMDLEVTKMVMKFIHSQVISFVYSSYHYNCTYDKSQANSNIIFLLNGLYVVKLAQSHSLAILDQVGMQKCSNLLVGLKVSCSYTDNVSPLYHSDTVQDIRVMLT